MKSAWKRIVARPVALSGVLLVWVFPILLLPTALLAAASWGFYRRRPWGWALSVSLSALVMVGFPAALLILPRGVAFDYGIGFICMTGVRVASPVSGLLLWLLFSPRTRRLFGIGAQPDRAAAGPTKQFQFRLHNLFTLMFSVAVCLVAAPQLWTVARRINPSVYLSYVTGCTLLLCPLTWRLAPRQAKIGAVSAMLSAFPIAAICALVYRFPVPFSGYESGVRAVPRAIFAALGFELIGGGLVLLLGGSAAGALAGFCALRAHVASSAEPRRFGDRLALVSGMLAALGAVLLLALLDKIIGRW